MKNIQSIVQKDKELWINGEKITKKINLPNHEIAFKIVTEELLNYKVVNDLSEIDAIGHRVVHGGDKYADSVGVALNGDSAW